MDTARHGSPSTTYEYTCTSRTDVPSERAPYDHYIAYPIENGSMQMEPERRWSMAEVGSDIGIILAAGPILIHF